MRCDPTVIQERLENFRRVLKGAGVKVTQQRLEIYREAARSAEHPDAERVLRGVRHRMPTISLDTVYRTLWLFLDLGLITTVGPPRARTRFDAEMAAHHHFICMTCGDVRDFRSPEFDRLKPPDVVKEFGRGILAQVQVKGTCARCCRRKAKTLQVQKGDVEE